MGNIASNEKPETVIFKHFEENPILIKLKQTIFIIFQENNIIIYFVYNFSSFNFFKTSFQTTIFLTIFFKKT